MCAASKRNTAATSAATGLLNTYCAHSGRPEQNQRQGRGRGCRPVPRALHILAHLRIAAVPRSCAHRGLHGPATSGTAAAFRRKDAGAAAGTGRRAHAAAGVLLIPVCVVLLASWSACCTCRSRACKSRSFGPCATSKFESPDFSPSCITVPEVIGPAPACTAGETGQQHAGLCAAQYLQTTLLSLVSGPANPLFHGHELHIVALRLLAGARAERQCRL